jgi:hypothetical protein
LNRGETRAIFFTYNCLHDISYKKNSIPNESRSIDAIIIPPKLANNPKTSCDYGIEQLR